MSDLCKKKCLHLFQGILLFPTLDFGAGKKRDGKNLFPVPTITHDQSEYPPQPPHTPRPTLTFSSSVIDISPHRDPESETDPRASSFSASDLDSLSRYSDRSRSETSATSALTCARLRRHSPLIFIPAQPTAYTRPNKAAIKASSIPPARNQNTDTATKATTKEDMAAEKDHAPTKCPPKHKYSFHQASKNTAFLSNPPQPPSLSDIRFSPFSPVLLLCRADYDPRGTRDIYRATI